MAPELIVTSDIVESALVLFREARPRTIVLAGGVTPRPVYQRLAREPSHWDGMEVFFSDERCVSPHDPASNYHMASRALLSFVPAHVHRMPGETCDSAAYEEELRGFFAGGQPEFDFAFLGLGSDGHTASLFPGDAALELPGLSQKTGPTSTALGSAVAQAVVVETVARLLQRGYAPPVFVSANIPGGPEQNEKTLARYRDRIRFM